MAKTTFFEYLQNTEDAISSGRIDDAMTNCQHILSYFPDSLEAQRLLGRNISGKRPIGRGTTNF